jgi:D-alanyl-lipoteichoic acid acyltransferase DltB (MBOAT superfamily)
MLFNSAVFIFAFLPVALAGYFALGWLHPRVAAVWLALASFAFYAYWNPPFVLLLVASIAMNYTFGILIRRFAKQPQAQSGVLAIAVTANILALVYFKYLFPLLAWLDTVGVHIPHSQDSVILPLGISFFTFTQLSYLIDARAGSIKEHGLLNYILFVTFFPHLIAGPILHHREMMPQFSRREVYRLNPGDFGPGVILFVIGLAKKTLIADHLAPLVAQVFDNVFDGSAGPALPLAWFGALAYSLQIYFDFSGYSDMAIGIARMFGIRFPLNFNSPYKAGCIIDFWQRWHMTLTRYLTSYLYNPAVLWLTRWRLERGVPASRAAISTPGGFASMIALPLLYTMLLAGIWHGAGTQFIVFGLLHGIYLTVNHAWRVFGPRPTGTPSAGLAASVTGIGSVLLTYVAVLVAQVFFRASSVGSALDTLGGMIGAHGHSLDLSLSPMPGGSAAIWAARIAGGFGLAWLLPNSNELIARYEKLAWPTAAQGLLFAGLFLVILIGASGPPAQFLYFQF